MFDPSSIEARRREARRRMMRSSGRRNVFKKRVLERDTEVRRRTLRTLAYLVIPLRGPGVLAEELSEFCEALLGKTELDPEEGAETDASDYDDAELASASHDDASARRPRTRGRLFAEREAQNVRHIVRLQSLLDSELERAERTTPYEKVAELMSAAAREGLTRIGFVTEPRSP